VFTIVDSIVWNIQHVTLIPGRFAFYEVILGYFDRAKPILKLLLASWTFYSFLKEFRSFNAENLGSLGQRAAKWPAIKLWEWFDPGTTRIRADWFESGRGQMADFFLRPPTLTASNFDALWPTDPIFTVFKDLNPFKRYFKYQEAGSILRVIFALSKWPHFTLICPVFIQSF